MLVNKCVPVCHCCGVGEVCVNVDLVQSCPASSAGLLKAPATLELSSVI